MATKLTLALVGGIVMVVVIAILLIINLTSPSRCMPKDGFEEEVTLQEDISTTNNSETPRQIIFVPRLKCGKGEMRDPNGDCKKMWGRMSDGKPCGRNMSCGL